MIWCVLFERLWLFLRNIASFMLSNNEQLQFRCWNKYWFSGSVSFHLSRKSPMYWHSDNKEILSLENRTGVSARENIKEIFNKPCQKRNANGIEKTQLTIYLLLNVIFRISTYTLVAGLELCVGLNAQLNYIPQRLIRTLILKYMLWRQ